MSASAPTKQRKVAGITRVQDGRHTCWYDREVATSLTNHSKGCPTARDKTVLADFVRLQDEADVRYMAGEQ